MQAHSKQILAGLLAALTLFVCFTFRTWLATCAIAMLAAVVVVIRRDTAPGESSGRLPRWLRWTLLALSVLIIVGVVGAWRLGDHLSESINPILVGVDILAHVGIVLSLAIYALRPTDGHLAMLPLGLLVMLCCVAAGGVSQALVGQTAVALCMCLGFVVASQIILGAVTRRIAGDSAEPPQGASSSIRVGPLYSLLTLSLIMMATSAVAKATSEVLPNVRESLHEQLKSTFDPLTEKVFVGGTRYVRGSALGSVRRHILGDPQEVALRIHADRAPGYLRGTVFDVYRRNRWHVVRNTRLPAEMRSDDLADRLVVPVQRGSAKLESRARNDLSRFQLDARDQQQTVALEILNDPLKGTFVFLPLATRWLEAKGSELIVSHHSVVRIGVDPTHPYVAGVASDVLPEELAERQRNFLLDLPPETNRAVARTSEKIFVSSTSAPGKAQEVVNYFQSNYAYSLNVTKSPSGVDPISHFLDTGHAAHCEYFATATVLLLRSAGVPARYVTGYVATEYSDENLYWLARNRDAHAWVEAYDDRSGKWFPVESTPGRTYQTINPIAADQFIDDEDFAQGDSWVDETETVIGRVWGWLTSIRATDPLMVVFRIAQLPLFCVVVFLLWWRFWRTSNGSDDAIDLQSRRMLRYADRLSRRRSFVRDRHETLHQFAERMERHQEEFSGRDDGLLVELAHWYRQYAAARYRGEKPVAFSR